MTLVITGDTVEEVEWKQDILMEKMKAFQVELSAAMGDQPYLMDKMTYANDLLSTDKNWIQPMSVESFCENLFFVTEKVGFDYGFYAARVDGTNTNYGEILRKHLRTLIILSFSILLWLIKKWREKSQITLRLILLEKQVKEKAS
ncbi:hypothetical protein [Lactococcus protaetiae]|uniref:hypothetical protein n=1 Tax=Lactococcus protaetiae TaxID=2592653 RepID=UPI001CC21CCA|nr:hypothetical protein [Lactococcus protaetiae]